MWGLGDGQAGISVDLANLAEGDDVGGGPEGNVELVGNLEDLVQAADHGLLKTRVDDVLLRGTLKNLLVQLLVLDGVDLGGILDQGEEVLLALLLPLLGETTEPDVRQVLKPLEVGHTDSTSVEVHVGDDDHTAVAQDGIGVGGHGAVGSLGDDLGLDPVDVGLVDGLLSGGGNEDITSKEKRK